MQFITYKISLGFSQKTGVKNYLISDRFQLHNLPIKQSEHIYIAL